MFMFLRPFAIASALTIFPALSQAATLATFDLTSGSSSSNLASNIESASFSTDQLSDNGIIVGDDGFGSVTQLYPNNGGTSAANSLSTDSYAAFTLTAASAQTLNLGSIAIDAGKGGDSDPRGFLVRGSDDSFASNLFEQILPNGSQQAPVEYTFNVPSSYSSDTSATFRVYVWTPNPSGNSVDLASATFSTSAVPEPSSWVILVAGFFGLGVALRSARRKAAQVAA